MLPLSLRRVMLKRMRSRAIPFVVLLAVSCVKANSQTPTVSPLPQPTTGPDRNLALTPLTLDEALRLANAVASDYQIAILNEKVAAEDIRQAQAAFLPKVSAPLS